MNGSSYNQPVNEGSTYPCGRDVHGSDTTRVVVLCGTHAQILTGEQGIIRVHSAYEAAAELLIAPADAMVIELACLQAPHLKLLELARSKNIEILGVGQFPASLTSDDLSGVRLTSLTDLPAAIAAIESHDTHAAPPQIEHPIIQPPTFEPRTETYQPPQPITEEIIIPPAAAPAPQAETAEQTPAAGEYIPIEPPASQSEAAQERLAAGEYIPIEPPPTRDDIPGSLDGLLSPEELSALLEDDE